MIGQVFKRWTVIREIPKEERRHIKRTGKQFLCRCECGIEKIVSSNNLKSKNSKSCSKCALAIYRKFDRNLSLEGQVFYDWTVIKKNNNQTYICRCKCGTEKELTKNRLLNGQSKCCKKCFLKKNSTRRTVSLEGKKINSLTVIKRAESRQGHHFYLCRCECGKYQEIRAASLKGTKTYQVATCRECSRKKMASFCMLCRCNGAHSDLESCTCELLGVCPRCDTFNYFRRYKEKNNLMIMRMKFIKNRILKKITLRTKERPMAMLYLQDPEN